MRELLLAKVMQCNSGFYFVSGTQSISYNSVNNDNCRVILDLLNCSGHKKSGGNNEVVTKVED